MKVKTPSHFVYILRSVNHLEQTYISYTSVLKNRLKDHNNGKSSHTAKYLPWKMIFYSAFEDKKTALDFEAYLKSHSGKAFSNKRLIPKIF
jgi:predicted GIY-YIG superfamily endonuclease